MKVTFLGATHEVTGSCTLLQACGKNIVIDCGMEQGQDVYENQELPIHSSEVDAVCLTHAHMDHSGMIPALVARGYSGPIYATEATYRLCTIMMLDSAHIQESEAEWKNRKAKRSGGALVTPAYTIVDAQNTLKQFLYYAYGIRVELFPGITATFLDAGHLLGSSSILFEIEEDGEKRSILFSGDLGNKDRPLIRDPQMPPEVDYVVVESTYGDRLHGERPDYEGQLSRIIQDTLDKGGNLVIPSFAIGRTQEMLYLIRGIKEKGLVQGHDGFPVYVDSPLAVEATKIYAAGLTGFYDRESLELLSRGIDPIAFPDLRLSVTSEESKAINENKEPKVIISTSGMCEAGRIRHHLKHNLWRGESTILFVGYQSQETVGRKLLEGADRVKIFGEEISVSADIRNLDGISGHADRDMILNWLKHTNAKQVFVNHGDDRVCDAFVQTVEEQLSFPAIAPYSGDSFDLISGSWLVRGEGIPASKRKPLSARTNPLYEKLVAAARRLTKLVERCGGLSNKLLARFTDQINSLCDKYE